MKQLAYLAALICALAFGSIARAQDTAWLQIEAQPNLRQAEERARAYAGAFANVNGFALPSGWYAIVLGPYGPDEALTALRGFRRERLIPDDSFVADGANFGRQFWPVGARAAQPQAPATDPAVPPAAAPPAADPAATAETPLQTAAETPRETPAEARRGEAQLTRGEREEIQRALQWDGFYDSAIDGAFGRGTRAAMADWQSYAGYEPTGVLTTRQRDALLTKYRKAQAALGLQTVRDEEAGIEITLPMALLSPAHYDAPFAQYDSKGDSGVRALLISEPGDNAALAGLYHVMQTLSIVPIKGTRELKDRSFVLSGRNDTLRSYTYAETRDGLIKGYTLVWSPERDKQMEKVLAAMKASFRPFGDQALDPAMVPVPAAQRQELLAGLEVRKPLLSRSGFFVDGRGTVLTTTDVLQSCDRITVGAGHAAEVSYRDDSLGLVVLTPKTALAPMAYAKFEPASQRPASEIAVAGYSYGGVLDAPAVTFGSLAAMTGLNGETALRRLSLRALPGDAGGPVLDRSGAVLGMLRPRPADSGRDLPEDVSFATGAAQIEDALSAAGVTTSPADSIGLMAPEDLSRLGRNMTVLVSCWK
ncbi:serine protease [Acidimangrovimonas pyrenivorans]|uniref:Serine protease n=1 Tax=Acidimangrovimonas pyrenivorans TaxID=2030798 RepID=A0ABV7AJQ7_9RHOB